MNVYYVVPSDDKGDYPFDRLTNKEKMIELAKQLFQEFKPDSACNFRVDVYLGDEEDFCPQFDPIFSIIQ